MTVTLSCDDLRVIVSPSPLGFVALLSLTGRLGFLRPPTACFVDPSVYSPRRVGCLSKYTKPGPPEGFLVLRCFFTHLATPLPLLGHDTTYMIPSFPFFVVPGLKSFAGYGGEFRVVYFLVYFLDTIVYLLCGNFFNNKHIFSCYWPHI